MTAGVLKGFTGAFCLCLVLTSCSGSSNTELKEGVSAPAPKEPRNHIASLAELRRLNARLAKEIPEQSFGKALAELNHLTWYDPRAGESGLPWSYPGGPLTPNHLYEANLDAEGVICRVFLHVTKNIVLNTEGHMVKTGLSRARVLQVRLVDYTAQKAWDWPDVEAVRAGKL